MANRTGPVEAHMERKLREREREISIILLQHFLDMQNVAIDILLLLYYRYVIIIIVIITLLLSLERDQILSTILLIACLSLSLSEST